MVTTKGGIRVVQYSVTPVAGSPWFTHKALNQWATNISSTLIQQRITYGDGRVFPYHKIFGRDSAADFEQADIVHLQNYLPPDALLPIIRKKPVLIQHHQHPPFGGTEVFTHPRKRHAIIAQPKWVEACRATGYRNQPVQLPNIVPIREFVPVWIDEPSAHRTMHVAYAPSARGGKKLHNKGYKGTRDVLESLAHQGHITYEIMEGLPLMEVLARKRHAHVVIDEVVTGNFHRCSLESLSQGCVVVAHLPPESCKYICDYTGSSEAELPWVITDMDGLYGTLGLLSSQPDFVVARRIKSRRWMEKYWDDQELVKQYVAVYEEMLSD